MQRLIRTFRGTIALGLFSVAGCATTAIPHELTDARSAYQHASASRASDLSIADVHRAKEALWTAEEAWATDPNSALTRDLAYVAQRKAQLAEAFGAMALAKSETTTADQSSNNSSP